MPKDSYEQFTKRFIKLIKKHDYAAFDAMLLGENPDLVETALNPCLLAAASAGNDHAFSILLKLGADAMAARDPDGNLAYYVAASGGA